MICTLHFVVIDLLSKAAMALEAFFDDEETFYLSLLELTAKYNQNIGVSQVTVSGRVLYSRNVE